MIVTTMFGAEVPHFTFPRRTSDLETYTTFLFLLPIHKRGDTMTIPISRYLQGAAHESNTGAYVGTPRESSLWTTLLVNRLLLMKKTASASISTNIS